MNDNLNSQQSVELGIRAAHLAKSALDLLGTHSTTLMKLQFARVVQELKEMDEFITRCAAGGNRQEPQK